MFFFPCRGHQEILRSEGKCSQYDPAPLVLVKDIMSYMPQMKYMFATTQQVRDEKDLEKKCHIMEFIAM